MNDGLFEGIAVVFVILQSRIRILACSRKHNLLAGGQHGADR